MTCIIATSEGVWADRRVSDSAGVRYRPTRKVARGEDIVGAFCGDYPQYARAMAALRAGETDVSAIALLSDGVLVNERGRWELEGGLAVRVPASAPIAVGGSGYAEAQAFLYGAGKYDDATIRAALRYVSRVRTDCGDGVDFLPAR